MNGSDPSFMSYYRLLNLQGPKNWFLLPWGQIVLRNLSRGKLVSYKSFKEFKQKDVPIWILNEMKIFKNTSDNSLFPVYQCTSCPSMDGLENLRIRQDFRSIDSLKCIHSRMCEKLTENRTWSTIWPVQLPTGNNIEHSSVSCNRDIKYVTLLGTFKTSTG